MRKINADRRELHCKIKKWQPQLNEHMPQVADLVASQESGEELEIETEKMSLHLPSDFTVEERQNLQIPNSIAIVELKLRKAEANDALKHLRTHINFVQGLQRQKGKVRYTKNLTRAVRIIHDAGKARDSVADTYRTARLAIIALGGDGKKEFPVLLEKDLRPKSIVSARAKK